MAPLNAGGLIRFYSFVIDYIDYKLPVFLCSHARIASTSVRCLLMVSGPTRIGAPRRCNRARKSTQDSSTVPPRIPGCFPHSSSGQPLDDIAPQNPGRTRPCRAGPPQDRGFYYLKTPIARTNNATRAVPSTPGIRNKCQEISRLAAGKTSKRMPSKTHNLR